MTDLSARFRLSETSRAGLAVVRHEMVGAATMAALALAVVLAAGMATDLDGRLDLLSHFRAHLVALLAGCAGLLALGRAWLRAAVTAAAAAAITGGLVVALYGQAASMVAGPADLSLISFNMQGNNEEGARIVDRLTSDPADVAILLEAGPVYPMMDRIRAVYPHRSTCPDDAYCDLLLVSRYPMIAQSYRDLGDFRRLVVATVEAPAGPVTVIGIHTAKPWHDGLLPLQLLRVTRRLDGIEGPVIVAGDFNATPWSKTISHFMGRNGLKLAPGYRGSWPSQAGPFGFPIDHVMVRGPVRPVSVKPLEDDFTSNHRGFLSTYRMVR